jgi:tetratricopeptide (TPR) repeat protein
MLTGRWPWQDGLQVNGDKPVEDHGVTLAQILARGGWRTAGFVSCRVLDHRMGFSKGFRHFDDNIRMGGGLAWEDMPERRGDITVSRVIKWLEKEIETQDRLFLWVHLFDPHFPYTPPGGPFKGVHGDYLGEVAFADRQIRRLSETLTKLGRSINNSLWVVLSDHGEALGAHGEDTHGLLLHGVTTRIPLLIAGPGVPVRRYEKLAATIDVFSTILDYIGVKAPECDGLNLLNQVGNEDRAIPMEAMMAARGFGISGVSGIRSRNWLWEASPEDYLWDLEKNPLETENLAEKLPGKVKSLRELRKSFGSTTAHRRAKTGAGLMKDLQSLGYITGNMQPGKESVRDFLKIGGEWHKQAVFMQKNGKYTEADKIFRRFLKRYRNSANIWQKAGMVSVQLQDFTEAEKRFRRSIELDPQSAAAHLDLANVLYFKKRYGEAEQEYKKVLEADPEDMFALYNLGLLFAKKGRYKEAAVFWEKYLEFYPSHKNAQAIRKKLQDSRFSQ